MSDQEKPADSPQWHQSVWDELHRLAELALRREVVGHSLQPTMLVDDAYMYLLRQRNVDMGHRSQVLAVGASFCGEFWSTMRGVERRRNGAEPTVNNIRCTFLWQKTPKLLTS